MRIAVVHNQPCGGARRRLESQLEYLAGEIVEICLETAAPIRPDAVVVPLRQAAPHRSRLLRPPFRYLDLAALERAWRRAAKKLRSSGADVVYLNPCRYLQAPPVLVDGSPPALYFCDEPRRVDADAAENRSRNPRTRHLYAPLYARERRLDRMTTARARHLATNSHYTASEIERVYGRTPTVLTMGVAEELLRRQWTAEHDDFLLSVGTLIPTKGHDLVLRTAAAAEPQRPVVIISPRPAPDEEARLRGLAEQLGVDAEIRVGITDSELARLYATAYSMLYLARSEPLGLASLEAQACGCPVIVAAEGGLPETVIDGVTGWHAPRDPAVVAALVNRLSDPSLRARMSASARSCAAGWRWKASAEQLERLLIEVSNQRGSAA